MSMVEFDAEAETNRLQDAVRRHDRELLDELVSERFALVSGRSLGCASKDEWVTAALSVAWRSFVISIARVIALTDVAVVDYDIEQEMVTPPVGPLTPQPTLAG